MTPPAHHPFSNRHRYHANRNHVSHQSSLRKFCKLMGGVVLRAANL